MGCRLTMDIPSKSWNVEPYSVPEIEECWIEKEEREQREAQQQAYDELERRVKERKALRAKKLEEKKKEQLLNGNNEPVTEPAAESKDDDSNLLNGNQPEDSSEPPLVLDDIEAPNGVEANPEDDTEISPVHRRPSDDKSPNPYRQHLSENDTVSASNDADLVSGDQ